MTTKQHKLRSRFIIAIAIVVIFSAVVFSVFRAAIPYVTDYGEAIERELTAKLGMPVEIGMIDADISWLIPHIKLLDVSIYDKKHERHFLYFREISVSLNWIQSIRNMQPELGDIYVSGMDLQVERDRNGKLLVQGMDIAAANQTGASAPARMMSLFEKSSLYLVDSSIHWFDQLNNSQRLDLTKVNITMLNNGSNHKVSIDMDLPASYGRHFQILSDFEGAINDPHSWKGRAYVSVEDFQLDTWLNDYWQFVEFPGAGEITANVWMAFDGMSIQRVTAGLDANDLVLYHLADDVQSWKLDHVSLMAKWSQMDNRTVIDIRDLYVQRNGKLWAQKSAALLNLYENNRINLQANYARLEDLVYIISAVDVIRNDLTIKAQDAIDVYSIKGDLYDVEFSIDLDKPEDVETKVYFDNLGYLSTTETPSVSGLDGYLEISAYQGLLDFISSDVVLGFNDLFRNNLYLDYFEGKVNITKNTSGWHIESDHVVAQTPHINTDSRMHIVIPDEGSVFLDIVSRLHDGDGAYTGQYLPAGIMSDETVNWLDQSIVRANIPQGAFVYYGNTSDFPFPQGEGVMEVLFDIKDARLQYLPDWPAITNLQASVLFYNSSFSIENATGHIYGADLSRTNVAIENLKDAHLSINGDIESPLSDLVLFIRNSPLKETLGSFVSGLKARGRSDLDLDLQIPLSTDANVKVKGELLFKNNEIMMPDLGYLLNSVNGQLSFSESSTSAEKLQAKMAGNDLGISIQPMLVDGDSQTRILVSGHLPVNTVLSPMPVLKKYLEGSTDWDVAIGVNAAKNRNQPKVSIQVLSDLKGVSSVLPVPFEKNTADLASFKLNINVLPEDRLDLMLSYDESISLKAEYKKQLWDIGLSSPQLKGGIQFSGRSILHAPVSLDIDYLNLSAYLKKESSLVNQTLKPDEVPVFKLKAKEIVWKDIQFKNISVKTRKTKSGMAFKEILLDGPDVHLKGNGSWESSWRTPNHTIFDFTLTTNNLGRSLSGLDISKSIEGAKGTGHFKWVWDAEPYNFHWDQLEGTASLNLKDGRLVDIEPGAGRILGIFNFETLLSLDFGKQVSGGFAFDDMKGSFKFSDGNVYTDNFRIKGKVADISMQGRVGLTNEDYDQIITVIPGVGSTLSVIGTVAGGATIGAAILFFQKMLGLDKIAEYKYSVTGSWEKPEVKLLSAPKQEAKNQEFGDDDF